MEKVRQHKFVRFLCGLVAVLILNISVDAPDFLPNTMTEDLSYNDIESVVEFVLEDVMGVTNAIAEHDDNDENESQKVGKHVDLFFQKMTIVFAISPFQPNTGRVAFFNSIFLPQSAVDELIQPPDALPLSLV